MSYLTAHPFVLSVLTALVAALAQPAAADEDRCRVPMADWQPREAVKAMAEKNGWTVRRIKLDDGCYEIDARDAQGRRVEVQVDPATLAVLDIEFEDEAEDHGEHEEGEHD